MSDIDQLARSVQAESQVTPPPPLSEVRPVIHQLKTQQRTEGAPQVSEDRLVELAVLILDEERRGTEGTIYVQHLPDWCNQLQQP